MEGFGLALGGGGTKGAYHLGVWQAMERIGIKISAICGTSIGSINGALFAQGDYEKALGLWSNISLADIIDIPAEEEENLFDSKNIISIIDEIYTNKGLETGPLRHLIDENCSIEKLMASPVDFGLVTFSLDKFEAKEIYKADIPEGKLTDYLMASASLPGFKNTVIDSQKFIDGGVVNNIPVNMLIKKGYKDIISVDVGGAGVVKNEENKGVNIIRIKCSENVIGHMDFNPRSISMMIRLGYFDTLRAFARIEGERYSFNISDYHAARLRYSKDITDGVETAAKIFGINNLKIYEFETLARAVRAEYEKEKNKVNENINVFEAIADEKRKLIKITNNILSEEKENTGRIVNQLFSDTANAANAIAYFCEKDPKAEKENTR